MMKYARIMIIVILIIRAFYIAFFVPMQEFDFGENEIILKGFVDDYKDERIGSNRYRIRIENINNIEIKEKARILLVTNPYINFDYGDELLIKSTIEKPKDFITDSGKTFDYEAYLYLDKIYGITHTNNSVKIGQNKGNVVTKYLFKIRLYFSNILKQYLSTQNLALTKGVLLGERSGLTNDFQNSMQRTSTTHIIALSGYNISIIAEAFNYILKSLSLVLRSIFSSLGIVLFFILAGGGSSALRALIMGMILIYGRMRGYEYKALYGLLVAFVIIITISPLSLRYDTGLHLSVLATFGLLAYTPYFQKKINAKNKFTKLISEIVSTTISATIMTLPYIIYKIGILSMLGIFVNFIIIPLVPILMFFGFVTGASGIINTNIGFIPGFITNVTANTMTGIIEQASMVPWSAIQIKHIPLFVVCVIYVFLFYKGFKVVKKFS